MKPNSGANQNCTIANSASSRWLYGAALGELHECVKKSRQYRECTRTMTRPDLADSWRGTARFASPLNSDVRWLIQRTKQTVPSRVAYRKEWQGTLQGKLNQWGTSEAKGSYGHPFRTGMSLYHISFMQSNSCKHSDEQIRWPLGHCCHKMPNGDVAQSCWSDSYWGDTWKRDAQFSIDECAKWKNEIRYIQW